jgi:hypothetical protein
MKDTFQTVVEELHIVTGCTCWTDVLPACGRNISQQ